MHTHTHILKHTHTHTHTQTHTHTCVCVCVCVWEREWEIDGGGVKRWGGCQTMGWEEVGFGLGGMEEMFRSPADRGWTQGYFWCFLLFLTFSGYIWRFLFTLYDFFRLFLIIFWLFLIVENWIKNYQGLAKTCRRRTVLKCVIIIALNQYWYLDLQLELLSFVIDVR